MPFYKKKPIVIEAQQLTRDNWAEIAEWIELGGSKVAVRWTQRAVPELDINPWARFIAGKSYAYYVATAPLAEVPALLAPPLDERERVGAEAAIVGRPKVQ